MKESNLCENKRSMDKVDYPIFIIAVLGSILFYAPMVIFKDTAGRWIPQILNAVTYRMDWCFELIGFICVLFSCWLIFGKYGKVKLGGEDAVPQFKTFTWIAMIFCAGVGAGILYWACAEPLSYLSNPPFSLEPFSNDARNWAMTYTCFHWSFTPWAIYAVPAAVFAYKFYNRNCSGLRASYACSGILGKHTEGKEGKVIDIFVIIGLLGGLTTSLGFVFPFVSGLISNYLGIEDGLYLQIIVGVCFTCIFTFSCVKGLYSGISKLSDFNMALFFILILFVLISGPTLWILSFFIESFSSMLQHFISMSFYMDKVGNSGFAQNWTVFYWAWQISWAVYIGLFTARVSRGRTIRSLVLSVMVAAGGGTALICGIIGGYTQYVYYDLGIDLIAIQNSLGTTSAIYTMFSTLPFIKIFIPALIIILLVAQATGIDSAAYTLSNISCKNVNESGEPPLFIRLFWAFMIFFATLALIIVGGMEAVKISATLTSIPIIVLLVILMLSLYRWLKEDFKI